MACKVTFSFFLGFFLAQQHLMMQMRKRRSRIATASATAMSAHLGTGATRWTEELKQNKNMQSAFIFSSYHYKVAFGGLDPKILKRPNTGRLQVETVRDMGNKDLSWGGVGLLCSIPGHGGPHFPLENRIWNGGEERMQPGTEAGPIGSCFPRE